MSASDHSPRPAPNQEARTAVLSLREEFSGRSGAYTLKHSGEGRWDLSSEGFRIEIELEDGTWYASVLGRGQRLEARLPGGPHLPAGIWFLKDGARPAGVMTT